jgi:hypothetical protein
LVTTDRSVQNIKLWNAGTGEQVQAYAESSLPGVVHFSPDGTRIGYGRTDASVVLARTSISAPITVQLRKERTNWILTWTGGIGPFQVQRKVNWSAEWQNFGSSGTARGSTNAATDPTAFFRVQDLGH